MPPHTQPRDAWAEINARPSALRPFGSALQGLHSLEPLLAPPLITTRVRRLRSEPPCPSCGNKSAWRCECELEDE